MSEKWENIQDYNGTYQVSTYGNVRNAVTGRFKKPTVTSRGYLRTQLSRNGANKRVFVHRLVAEAFLGVSDLQVNHKNSDKKDNRLSNLEFVSASENQAHRYRANGKRRGVRRIRNKFRAEISISGKKLSLGSFEDIEDAYATYSKAYASHYGVNPWIF